MSAVQNLYIINEGGPWGIEAGNRFIMTCDVPAGPTFDNNSSYFNPVVTITTVPNTNAVNAGIVPKYFTCLGQQGTETLYSGSQLFNVAKWSCDKKGILDENTQQNVWSETTVNNYLMSDEQQFCAAMLNGRGYKDNDQWALPESSFRSFKSSPSGQPIMVESSPGLIIPLKDLFGQEGGLGSNSAFYSPAFGDQHFTFQVDQRYPMVYTLPNGDPIDASGMPINAGTTSTVYINDDYSNYTPVYIGQQIHIAYDSSGAHTMDTLVTDISAPSTGALTMGWISLTIAPPVPILAVAATNVVITPINAPASATLTIDQAQMVMYSLVEGTKNLNSVKAAYAPGSELTYMRNGVQPIQLSETNQFNATFMLSGNTIGANILTPQPTNNAYPLTSVKDSMSSYRCFLNDNELTNRPVVLDGGLYYDELLDNTLVQQLVVRNLIEDAVEGDSLFWGAINCGDVIDEQKKLVINLTSPSDSPMSTKTVYLFQRIRETLKF